MCICWSPVNRKCRREGKKKTFHWLKMTFYVIFDQWNFFFFASSNRKCAPGCGLRYKEEHPPSQCTKVTNIKARMDILRKFAKCFVCLQGGHVAKKCNSSYACRKCDGRHHISICEQKLVIKKR